MFQFNPPFLDLDLFNTNEATIDQTHQIQICFDNDGGEIEPQHAPSRLDKNTRLASYLVCGDRRPLAASRAVMEPWIDPPRRGRPRR